MAIHKIQTLGMTREAWLAERKKSLGGSDMGAVLGLNHFSSPAKVWAEKTGRLPDEPDNEAMRVGRDLEDYVARRFEEASGKRVRRCNYILRNDDAPHLHANIDRDIVGEDSGLECKTASALSTKNYTTGGEFPESYYAQCVSYIAVTGHKRWYLAVLILGRCFKVYQLTTATDDVCPPWCESSVYVSPDELSALRTAAADFWTKYIETDTMPPADGEAATTETLGTIYAGNAELDAPVDLFGRDALFAEYFTLKESGDAVKKRMEELKQLLMQDLGDNIRGACGRYSVLWKPQERRTLDAKALAKDHPEIDLAVYYKVTAMRPLKITMEKESA
jgi:putative phage-type endonuclease